MGLIHLDAAVIIGPALALPFPMLLVATTGS